MGRSQRDKGAAGELEVQAIARAAGFTQARRAFASGAQGGGDLTGIPGVCIEVKRTERLRLGEAYQQAAAAAAPGEVPVVAHRSNRQPWLVTIPADEYFALLAFRSFS